MQVPAFFSSQILVNVVLGRIVEPSGIVTSRTKLAWLLQFGSWLGVFVFATGGFGVAAEVLVGARVGDFIGTRVTLPPAEIFVPRAETVWAAIVLTRSSALGVLESKRKMDSSIS